MGRDRRQPSACAWLVAMVCLAAAGCSHVASVHQHFFGHVHGHHADASQMVMLPNPLFVPVANADFVWDQVVDALDDYFKIEREERVRIVGDVMTEGRLSTYPTTGATYLEPWRGDSTHGYERMQSTLQSIRRTATARVTPATGGFYIEIVVAKELEDLFQPEYSPIGGPALRHDGTIIRTEAKTRGGSPTLGWIPLGRDPSLEQRILVDLQSRLGTVSPADYSVPPLQ